jgi:uncharacterized protein YhaN
LVSQRIFSLADETGLRVQKATQLAQLDALMKEHREHQQRVTRRKELRKKARALKLEALHHVRAARGLGNRRGALFQKCGVADEHELRQHAAKLGEADELRKKRSAVTREIVAALGKHGSEIEFAPLLTAESIGRLESDWETLSSDSESLERELKELLQRRGALVEQQRAQAADRSLARTQVALDVVEVQLQRATAAWRERAAVSLFLERIREDYEQHRQPETLREASGYLSQLTSGKYTRIWTPLAHDILFVDNAEGQSLPVQVLSRGTREQLFVSLRLALVSAFARRGIHLPMILDDVFVNFDAGRTRIAAAVLRDFAKQGHQLIVFTCHEHVWRMFQEIKVDARQLPNRHGEEPEEKPAPEPVPVIAAEPEPVAAPVPVIEVKAELPPPPPPQPAKPLPTLTIIERPAPPPEPPAPIDDELEFEIIDDHPDLPPARITSQAEVEYWWPEEVGSR